MLGYDRRDSIAWLTLNRSDSLNALTADGWEDLKAAVDRAEEEARVAVIQGCGDAFCVGEDMEWLSSITTPPEVADFVETVTTGLSAIEGATIPIITAVDGPAYGAGFDLVVASHLAVATKESTFAFPETRIGAYPGYALERMTGLCTRKRFLELVLTGNSIDAETAQEWGLINRVTGTDELEADVAELADDILASPARPLALVSRSASKQFVSPAEYERQMGLFTSLFLADEFQEGIQAFLDGRKPAWQE